MSDDDPHLLRTTETKQDIIVAVALRGCVAVAKQLNFGLRHVIVLGELIEGNVATAFAAGTGANITSGQDTIRFLDYHLSKAVEAEGGDWREYKLNGTERPK